MTDDSSSEAVILSADEAMVYDLLNTDSDTMDDMLEIRSIDKWLKKRRARGGPSTTPTA